MTLAKKGTRCLTVDGCRYRWVVAPDDEPGLAIVVEEADAGGQRLVTWVEHGTVITPALVVRTIRQAQESGWVPGRRGSQLNRRYAPDDGFDTPTRGSGARFLDAPEGP
ncbi:hypothetical protein ACFYZ9_19015 [Streptomyces sp. NPDC001691]|uniref:hypothetical protein n=1 Tax=Streptomyces sp. NPDC001691 TaxID=3364600 RepID=UPI003693B270